MGNGRQAGGERWVDFSDCEQHICTEGGKCPHCEIDRLTTENGELDACATDYRHEIDRLKIEHGDMNLANVEYEKQIERLTAEGGIYKKALVSVFEITNYRDPSIDDIRIVIDRALKDAASGSQPPHGAAITMDDGGKVRTILDGSADSSQCHHEYPRWHDNNGNERCMNCNERTYGTADQRQDTAVDRQTIIGVDIGREPSRTVNKCIHCHEILEHGDEAGIRNHVCSTDARRQRER